MRNFFDKIKTSDLLMIILTLILLTSIVAVVFSYAFLEAFNEEFVLSALEKTDFFHRVDELFIKENFNQWEDLSRGHKTLNFLISEIDRTKVLRESAENFVPGVIKYVTGQTDQLDIMVKLNVLEEALSNKLGDFDTFKKILEIEIPREAEILRNLPEDIQKSLHDTIKSTLVDQVTLPDQLALDYFFVEFDLKQHLETVRDYHDFIEHVFTVGLVLSASITGLLAVWGKSKGIIWIGAALFVSGTMSISAEVHQWLVSLAFYERSPQELSLFKDIFTETVAQMRNIGYGTLLGGAVLVVTGSIMRLR